MQRLKWTLMIAAIVLGVGGAILTHLNAPASKATHPFYAANGCVPTPSDLPQAPATIR